MKKCPEQFSYPKILDGIRQGKNKFLSEVLDFTKGADAIFFLQDMALYQNNFSFFSKLIAINSAH